MTLYAALNGAGALTPFSGGFGGKVFGGNVVVRIGGVWVVVALIGFGLERRQLEHEIMTRMKWSQW